MYLPVFQSNCTSLHILIGTRDVCTVFQVHLPLLLVHVQSFSRRNFSASVSKKPTYIWFSVHVQCQVYFRSIHLYCWYMCSHFPAETSPRVCRRSPPTYGFRYTCSFECISGPFPAISWMQGCFGAAQLRMFRGTRKSIFSPKIMIYFERNTTIPDIRTSFLSYIVVK